MFNECVFIVMEGNWNKIQSDLIVAYVGITRPMIDYQHIVTTLEILDLFTAGCLSYNLGGDVQREGQISQLGFDKKLIPKCYFAVCSPLSSKMLFAVI